MKSYFARALFAMFMATLLTTVVGFVIVGCDEYDRIIGEDDDSNLGLPGALPSGAISGVYLTTITTHSQNSAIVGDIDPCKEASEESQFLVNVVQSGPNSYLISGGGDDRRKDVTINATLTGNILTFQIVDEGETSDVTWAFVILPDGTSIFTGTGNTIDVREDFTCTATDEYSGTRFPVVPDGKGLTGTWTVDLSSKGECTGEGGTVRLPVGVVQEGSAVEITVAGVAVLNGVIIDTVSTSTLSISGTFTDAESGETVVVGGFLDAFFDNNTVRGSLDFTFSPEGKTCTEVVFWDMSRVDLTVPSETP